MASLRQIKRRMKSVENIHEITKAMEMIAAFRFKKAEGRWRNAKPNLLEMERLVGNLSTSSPDLTHPLFKKREVKTKAIVVVTGDKGLCGAYNANLLRAANLWLKGNGSFKTFIIAVGKVGYDFFRKKQVFLLAFYPEKAMVDLVLAQKITADLKRFFLSQKVDSLELLYTSYRGGGTGQNHLSPFLGLDYLLENNKHQKVNQDYIYEPDFDHVFNSLLSRYLEEKVYLCLLESLTSEYSARMIAMKQATENGEEVLDSLTLLRNKTRQATITRELSEIVGGANILV